MKKFAALALMPALILVVSGPFSYAQVRQKMTQKDYLAAAKVEKSTQARYLITTDLEADDINGVIMAMMYSNEYDLAGIVWTSGQWHFSGDGKHTLAEITPNWRCRDCTPTYKSYRPVDPQLMPRLLRDYAADYKYLSQNNPNYPTPEKMAGIYKVGNTEFEGDVRSDTEGSELIRKAMLDNDPRPLFIAHWGGSNTTVRALLKIYADYKGTSQWEAIRKKITDKVYFMGRGEDYTWSDQKIDEIYPGLKSYRAGGYSSYGSYFSPHTASPDVRPFLQGDWTASAFKLNHGRLMNDFYLMGDGQKIEGETDYFQTGLNGYIDWPSRPPLEKFNKFDWCCLQYNGLSFVNFGMRGSLQNPGYGTISGRISVGAQSSGAAVGGAAATGAAVWAAGSAESKQNAPLDFSTATRFVGLPPQGAAGGAGRGAGPAAPGGAGGGGAGGGREYNPVTGSVGAYSTRFSPMLFEEWAARADWTIADYKNANHPPIVAAKAPDVTAKAGQIVELAGAVTDPDGDEYDTTWSVWNGASEYAGAGAGMLDVWDAKTLTAKFTVPRDAKAGDYFNVLMQVQDKAKRPMTRFAQFIITVGE